MKSAVSEQTLWILDTRFIYVLSGFMVIPQQLTMLFSRHYELF